MFFQSFGFYPFLVNSFWVAEFLSSYNSFRSIFGFSFRWLLSCWCCWVFSNPWCCVINSQTISSPYQVVLRHYLNWVIFSGVPDLLVVAFPTAACRPALRKGDPSNSHSGGDLKILWEVGSFCINLNLSYFLLSLSHLNSVN